MGSFASLARGVTVEGGAAIGDYSAICLRTSIINGVRIGSHSVVGTKALVVRDIPDLFMAYGVPAVVVRTCNPSDHYL
jgi:acetyltransferase-like isoleucine patch superfamily enzyme